MDWNFRRLGSCRGELQLNHRSVAASEAGPVCADPSGALLCSRGGKLGDSEDSFLYFYGALDPNTSNFVLSAELRARLPEGSVPNAQTGWGILLADTDASPSKYSRHRNHLLLGVFGPEHRAGLRVVSGYRSPEADEAVPVRVHDPRRRFAYDGPVFGETFRVRLEKTDEGLRAFWEEEEIFFPGCDLFTAQDPRRICVGFAAAGFLTLEIGQIRLETGPGVLSRTPNGTSLHQMNPYPFPRALLAQPAERPLHMQRTLRVSPSGTPDAPGTPEAPMDLPSALARAGTGTRLELEDGCYRLDRALYVSPRQSGTGGAPVIVEALHPRRAVLDGSALAGPLPIFTLEADWWQLKGLVFRGGSAAGLFLCGSGCTVENCEALENGDTGMLLCAMDGAEPPHWPAYNQFLNCDSHHNRDAARFNADGFGAKLRVGPGNLFCGCAAYHNIDDGFDLYAKSAIGPIRPVELDGCVAYGNGRPGRDGLEPRGVGFKLGGENQAAAHRVWNCLAYDNAQLGFSSNSNPAGELHFCTAVRNGTNGDQNFLFYSARPGSWVTEGLYPDQRGRSVPRFEQEDASPSPSRREDGSLELHGLFQPPRDARRRRGADLRGERKKLLILVSSLYGGGAERVACQLASALARRHQVTLLYYMDKGAQYPLDPRVRLISRDLRSRPWPTFPGRMLYVLRQNLRQILFLRRFKRSEGIDGSISLLRQPNFYNALSGGYRILSERNDPSRKGRRYRLWGRVSFALGDRVVFQSEKVQKMFSPAIRRKSMIVPNPVRVSCTAQPGDGHRIVSVGRLVPQKNLSLLLRAFARFAQTHPEHRLYIYGDGPLREQLEKEAAALGLEGRAEFYSFLPQIHEAIRDAEMFVLSSDFEGLSNALMEAMMMGLPCISTACTGSDELLEEGVTGLLVPVGDEQALSDAMARLAEDPALRASLGRNAMLRAEDFRVDRVVRRWERTLL